MCSPENTTVPYASWKSERLIIFPILVLVAVSIYTYVDKKLDNLSLVGFSLIIGGGIANIFDRIVYGSVTDFLYINLGFFKTGIFNIADLSVTTGMILILIDIDYHSIQHSSILQIKKDLLLDF